MAEGNAGASKNSVIVHLRAQHDATDWQANLELMLHELAHRVVQSNDHLSHRIL
jgi:hypothetical protein